MGHERKYAERHHRRPQEMGLQAGRTVLLPTREASGSLMSGGSSKRPGKPARRRPKRLWHASVSNRRPKTGRRRQGCSRRLLVRSPSRQSPWSWEASLPRQLRKARRRVPTHFRDLEQPLPALASASQRHASQRPRGPPTAARPGARLSATGHAAPAKLWAWRRKMRTRRRRRRRRGQP